MDPAEILLVIHYKTFLIAVLTFSLNFGAHATMSMRRLFSILLRVLNNSDISAITPIWLMLGLGGIAYSIIAQFILGKACIYCLSIDTIIALFVALYVM